MTQVPASVLRILGMVLASVAFLVSSAIPAAAAELGSAPSSATSLRGDVAATNVSAGRANDLLCRLFRIGCPAPAKPAPKPAPVPTPRVPTIGATVTAGDIRIDHAIAWAKSMVGSHGHDGWCLLFVEKAYGTSGGAPTAYDEWLRLGKPNAGADPSRIPTGAIVFFGPSAPGHAGLSLGNGMMVSAVDRGPQTGVRITTVGYAKNYVGWSMPPANWPGR